MAFSQKQKTYLRHGAALALPLCLLANGAQADNRSAELLAKAEHHYRFARDDWEVARKQRKAQLDRLEKENKAHDGKVQSYWDKRRKHALKLNKNAQERQRLLNENEAAYREARRAEDRLSIKRIELWYEYERLSSLIDKGLATKEEKVRAQEVYPGIRQLDSRISKLSKRQKDLAEEARTLRKKFDDERAALLKAKPDRTALEAADAEYFSNIGATGPFPSIKDVSKLSEKTAEKALTFLGALLRTPPVHLAGVKATINGEPWYEAQVEDDALATGEGGSGAQAEGYRKALKQTGEELAELGRLIKLADNQLQRLRDRWEYQSEIESISLYNKAINERDAIVIGGIIEAGGIIISAAASGGAAAPAVHGMLSTLTAYAANKGTKLNNKLMKKLFAKALNTMNGRQAFRESFKEITDYFEAKAVSTAVMDARLNPYANAISSPAAIIVGDAIETFAGSGFKPIVDVINQAGTKAGVTTPAAAALLIPVATTLTKAGVQGMYDAVNDSEAADAFSAGVAAMLNRNAYLRMARARRVLRERRVHFKAVENALQDLIEHGPRRKKIDVKADSPAAREDLEKNGAAELTLTFSQPLSRRPKIKAKGVTFSKAGKQDEAGKVWQVRIESLNLSDNTSEIPLQIRLSRSEEPYAKLDSDPKSPLRLTSLDREGWQGYEAGPDRNHTLKLGGKLSFVIVQLPSMISPHDCHVKVVNLQQPDNWLKAKPDTPMFDSDRAKALGPLASSDSNVMVCVDPSGKPKKDGEGRVIAGIAYKGKPASNGYVPPDMERVNQIKLEVIQARRETTAAEKAELAAIYGRWTVIPQKLMPKLLQ